ncbi:hypothetical protein ACFLV3_02470 [Chloroflexota bacterium]
MPKCPNCGQPTARTDDWACQWCSYPLVSGIYKKISKTYKQVQEEKQPMPEPEPSPEPTPEPDPVSTPPPEPEPTPKAEPDTEPEPKLSPEVISELVPETTPELEPELEPESAPEPEPEPASAEMELTVEELYLAYEEGEATADAKLANKILKVTGVVSRIEVKEMNDIYYILITSADQDMIQNVRCLFDKQYGSELNRLTIGETVTVQGRYDGSLLNIRMRDCTLAS